MQGSNRKKLFNRVFLGATILWMLHCAVFVPVWQHHRDETADTEAMAHCLYGKDFAIAKPDASCMASAEGMHVIHRVEWSRYYGPVWWALLLVSCVGFPLLVYGATIASVAFLVKIRRLRGGLPPSGRDDQYA